MYLCQCKMINHLRHWILVGGELPHELAVNLVAKDFLKLIIIGQLIKGNFLKTPKLFPEIDHHWSAH